MGFPLGLLGGRLKRRGNEKSPPIGQGRKKTGFPSAGGGSVFLVGFFWAAGLFPVNPIFSFVFLNQTGFSSGKRKFRIDKQVETHYNKYKV